MGKESPLQNPEGAKQTVRADEQLSMSCPCTEDRRLGPQKPELVEGKKSLRDLIRKVGTVTGQDVDAPSQGALQTALQMTGWLGTSWMPP